MFPSLILPRTWRPSVSPPQTAYYFRMPELLPAKISLLHVVLYSRALCLRCMPYKLKDAEFPKQGIQWAIRSIPQLNRTCILISAGP